MSEPGGRLNIPPGMERGPSAPVKMEMSESNNRAVSIGALSDMQHQTTAMELIGLQVWHFQILKVYFPLCLAVILMSCMWAFIIAKRSDYEDPAGSWQGCLLAADYTYIPLNSTVTQIGQQIAAAKANVKTCFITNVLDGTCDGTCATSLITNCLSQLTPPSVDVQDIALPTGHFMDGFSYLGIQAIIFSSIAHGVLHRSLRHPSWLLSTSALMCWFLVAMFTYYTVGPILPVPNGINSTLLTYLIYTGKYSKFRDFNNGDNHCHYALRVAWTYEIFILCLCFTVFLGIIISIYAERVRYKSPNKPHYTHLKYTRAPVVFSGFAGLAYVFFLASKITSATTELSAIADFDVPLSEAGKGFWYPSIWFPFAVPTLDITTIVGICCVMSVLRGFTVQSLSAFRLAFMCACVYAVSIYPGLVGAYNFYDFNNFYSDHDCKNYFLGANTSVFGYPSDEQAKAYCSAFRLSLVSITVMCFAVHMIAIACAVCVRFNLVEGRKSLEHEVYDFDAANAFHDVASARGSFAVPIAPKPLLSRANTNQGAPTTGSGSAHGTPQLTSVYTSNPLSGASPGENPLAK